MAGREDANIKAALTTLAVRSTCAAWYCCNALWMVLAVGCRALRASTRCGGCLPVLLQRDADAMEQHLSTITAGLVSMQQLLARMGEHCDPFIYYQRVRVPM